MFVSKIPKNFVFKILEIVEMIKTEVYKQTYRNLKWLKFANFLSMYVNMFLIHTCKLILLYYLAQLYV